MCVVDVTFGLGALNVHVTAGNDTQLADIQLAEALMDTCYEMYRQTTIGLAPEVTRFQVSEEPFSVSGSADHNLLRPETIESLFILYRVTGDDKYVDWGWQIFRAFEMHSKWPKGGYTSTSHVAKGPLKRTDKMESFFIAETLKYLLLLFSPMEVRHCAPSVFSSIWSLEVSEKGKTLRE